MRARLSWTVSDLNALLQHERREGQVHANLAQTASGHQLTNNQRRSAVSCCEAVFGRL
jgi:hypothetical protein